MLPIFLLCLFVVFLCAYWYHWYKKYEDIRKLPGPPAHPIFGNMLDLQGDIDDIFETMLSLNERYGPVIKVWTNPFKPMLIVCEPKYVEILFSTYTHLDKSDGYKSFHPFLGQGLVTTKAEKWKKLRKMINPAFNNKALEYFTPVFEYHGNRFINLLREQVDKPSVNIVPLMDLFALDVINDSVMRTKTNFLYDADMDYLDARNGFLHIFMSRMYSYLKQIDALFRLTSAYQHQEKCARKLKQYSKNIILERKADQNNKAAAGEFGNVSNRKQVLVDLLLDSHVLSDDEIVDHVNTFVVAGHDTPATAMAFTVYEIANHARIQTKILEETVSILGRNKDVEITFQDMQQMKYLESVIKECLRYHTIVPFFDRKTELDLVIDGVKIPKGTDISVCAYRLHRDKRFWTDPEKFDPDRFLPENADKIQQYAYVPFSMGPRNCIGKNFSMLQMKSALAKMVRNFELHPAYPAHKIQFTSEFVLKSKNGLPIRLTERKL